MGYKQDLPVQNRLDLTCYTNNYSPLISLVVSARYGADNKSEKPNVYCIFLTCEFLLLEANIEQIMLRKLSSKYLHK